MTRERSSSLGYDFLMPLAPWEPAAVLQQALDSLRGQTLPPQSLVVSADGALPESLRQVLFTADIPVKLVEGPGGEGVGPVLARGLLACDQDLVVRVDADDVSLPHRCAQQVERMQADLHLAALSGLMMEFDSDSYAMLGIRTVPVTQSGIWSSRPWRNPMNHPAVILRRSAVLAVGNYRRKPGFEDYDLWLRLLKMFGANALANSEQVLVHARVGRAHLTRRHGWRYACAECAFYISCLLEGLMSPFSACLALALRLPARILPKAWLTLLMTVFRKPPV